MNKILIIAVFGLFCTACSTVQNTQNATLDYITGVNNLSKTESDALAQIKSDLNNGVTKVANKRNNLYAISQIKEEDCQSFDLYEVDVNKFFKNPKPQQIEAAIQKPTETIMLTSKDVNNITFIAKKVDNRWRLESSFRDSDVQFAWMKKIMPNMTDKSYKVLSILGRQVFVFNTKGKLTFYYPNGKPMSDEELYGFMKSIYDFSNDPNKDPNDVLVL